MQKFYIGIAILLSIIWVGHWCLFPRDTSEKYTMICVVGDSNEEVAVGYDFPFTDIIWIQDEQDALIK